MNKTSIIIEKLTTYKINEESGNDQLREIKRIATKAHKSVKARISRLREPETVVDGDKTSYRYRATVYLHKPTFRSADAVTEEFDYIYKKLKRACESRGWYVVGEGVDTNEPQDQQQYDQSPTADVNVVSPIMPVFEIKPFIVPVLTQELMSEYFDGIYERDPHIRVIHDAANNYSKSKNRRRRSHILLYGPPASCKTTLFERLKVFYEAHNTNTYPRVVLLDATTTTKAGLENFLLSAGRRNEMPDILILEEIEKYNPDNMLSLLAVMDARGKLSKTNARIGSVSVDAKILIFATCNDEEILMKWNRGALWSRFTKRLYCARPSYELMEKILLREVKDMEGKPEWVKSVIEFAKQENLLDPREIISLLDGEDRLLDGSYQRDMQKIWQVARQDKKVEQIAQKELEDHIL